MHVMFEVQLVPGASGANLLTQETLEDTQAQVLTRAQVETLGFQGLTDDAQGRERRFIIVRQRDQNRIANILDAHPEVPGFRVHEFDL
jgi:hypothetical protein